MIYLEEWDLAIINVEKILGAELIIYVKQSHHHFGSFQQLYICFRKSSRSFQCSCFLLRYHHYYGTTTCFMFETSDLSVDPIQAFQVIVKPPEIQPIEFEGIGQGDAMENNF